MQRLISRLPLTAMLLGLVGFPLAMQPPRAAAPESDKTITLRVRTPEYRLDGAGLRVPGYPENDVPAAPRLPVYGTTVELPPTGDYTISYRAARSRVIDAPDLLPSVPVYRLPTPGPESETADGDLPPPISVTTLPNPAIYQRDRFYPAAAVEPGNVLWQRGRRLLVLRVFPFQYNPVAGKLRYHPDLLITIKVKTKNQPADSTDAPRPVPTGPPPAAATPGGGAVRIRTADRGMHRLTYSDLQNAAVPVANADPATFAMSCAGVAVAIQVTGAEDGRFDPGDLIIFYAEPYEGRYMTQNVYRLTYGDQSPAAPLRIAERTATPTGSEPVVDVITQTVHIEYDRGYYSDYPLPADADHFFDTPINVTAPGAVVTRIYALGLDDPLILPAATPTATLTPTSTPALTETPTETPSDARALRRGQTTATPPKRAAGPATPTGIPVRRIKVQAKLYGGWGQTVNPDQSVELLLNGHTVSRFQWDGQVGFAGTATAPAEWLNESGNQLQLAGALAQLSGVSSYRVYPDWVDFSYPARADAEGDRIYIEGLEVTGAAAQVVVSGFTTDTVRVYDVRTPRQPVELTTVQAVSGDNGYTIQFWDDWSAGDPAPGYALTTRAALIAPAAVEAAAIPHLRDPANAADYIAIYHAALWGDSLAALLAQREAQGLRVMAVDVQEVYDEFSAGRLDPQAIRDFLSYAYHHWNAGGAPPKYVLLVGDGHYDFKNVQTGIPNFIPPYLLDIDPWIGETAADNRYVSVDPAGDANDYLPDMAIGRIPARSLADVTAVVSKTLAYADPATTPAGAWDSRIVFVADDDANYAGNFHAISDEVRTNWLPSEYASPRIYYRMDTDHDTGDEMRAAIKAEFNNRAVMLQWFGHASRFRWGSISMFNVYDPPALDANTAVPFSLAYSCWAGYFISLLNGGQQTLGEALVLQAGRGSVVDLSPSGEHLGEALLKLDQAIIAAVFRDRIRTVGEAVNQAKLYYAANTAAWPDVVDTSVLFGDPAVQLRVPVTPPAAPAIAASVANSAVALTWDHLADSQEYEIWRGANPYFEPAAEGVHVTTVKAGFYGAGTLLQEADDGSLPTPGVQTLGDVNHNYFWVVRSRNGDGVSGNSNRVGEFAFAIVAGD